MHLFKLLSVPALTVALALAIPGHADDQSQKKSADQSAAVEQRPPTQAELAGFSWPAPPPLPRTKKRGAKKLATTTAPDEAAAR